MNMQHPRAISWHGLALAALALGGCSRNDDQYGIPPAVRAAAKPQANVAAQAQFRISSESDQAVLGMKVVATCSLENVATAADGATNAGPQPNSYVVETGKAYKMIGFATNKEAGTVPRSIRLALVGGKVYSIQVVTGAERPDVAKYFGVPAFSGSGYQADAAFDNVDPGEYRVFVIEAGDPGPIACPTHQLLTVR